jgi:hypothetical protein
MLGRSLVMNAGATCTRRIRLGNKPGWASVWISGPLGRSGDANARRDDQGRYDASGAGSRVLAKLDRSAPNKPASASRLDLERGGADLDRYGQISTEPTLHEVFREPVIRLMMKCDNITEDQLLHLITMARRHMHGSDKS